MGAAVVVVVEGVVVVVVVVVAAGLTVGVGVVGAEVVVVAVVVVVAGVVDVGAAVVGAVTVGVVVVTVVDATDLASFLSAFLPLFWSPFFELSFFFSSPLLARLRSFALPAGAAGVATTVGCATAGVAPPPPLVPWLVCVSSFFGAPPESGFGLSATGCGGVTTGRVGAGCAAAGCVAAGCCGGAGAATGAVGSAAGTGAGVSTTAGVAGVCVAIAAEGSVVLGGWATFGPAPAVELLARSALRDWRAVAAAGVSGAFRVAEAAAGPAGTSANGAPTRVAA